MREMLAVTAALLGKDLALRCVCSSDGRFSGATHGLMAGHVDRKRRIGSDRSGKRRRPRSSSTFQKRNSTWGETQRRRKFNIGSPVGSRRCRDSLAG